MGVEVWKGGERGGGIGVGFKKAESVEGNGGVGWGREKGWGWGGGRERGGQIDRSPSSVVCAMITACLSAAVCSRA